MAIKHVGNAVFIDTDPIEEYPNVFSWVEFPTLEWARYGLSLMEGNDPEGKEIDSVEVGSTSFSPDAIAPQTLFEEAIEELGSGKFLSIEEFPMVEVTDESQWKEVQEIMAKKEPDTEPPAWEGPGIYDFRELHKAYDSVEAYELDGLTYWADDTIGFMFQGDEWKSSLKEMLDRNKPEGTEPVKAESSQFTHRRANKMDANEMLRMVANTGYTDIPGKLHAAYLLGQATNKFWKEAVAEIKKKFGKEMHREVDRLQRWGTAQPSEANIKDVIRKILIKNGIYPYSELVFALYRNPFGKTGRSGYQTRGIDADGMTPSRSEPR